VTLVAIGLATFWIVRQTQAALSAPTWFWPVYTLALSFGGVALWSGLDKWYSAFTAVGIVWFLDRLDDLAMVKGDELAKRVLQRR